MGAISVAWTADKIGRRLALGLVLSFRILSITLETVATTNPVFFGGRFVGGFSTGAMNTLCMTYIGEITPLRLRGVLTAAAPIALILGSFSAAIMVAYTGDQSSRWAYRTAFISSYGFVAVALIFLPFMPESPWWLINQDQNGRAIHALSRLGYVVDAEARASEIRRVLAKTKEETSGATYAECFQRSNLRRTVVSAMPLTIQTFSGVAFVASYSTYYQQLAGYSTAASFRLFIAQQVLSGSGNVCSWFLVDRLGRRPLTFWGMIILTALLMVTGGAYFTPSRPLRRRCQHVGHCRRLSFDDLLHILTLNYRLGYSCDTGGHPRHDRPAAALLFHLQCHHRRHSFHYPHRDSHSATPSQDSIHLYCSPELVVCEFPEAPCWLFAKSLT